MAKTPKSPVTSEQAPLAQTNPVSTETFPEPVAVVPTANATPLDQVLDVEQLLPTNDAFVGLPTDKPQSEIDAEVQPVQEPALAAAETVSEPLAIENPENVDARVKTERQDMGRQAFLQDIINKRNENTAKPTYVPPPPTERQMSKRDEELEAGRRAVARHAAQAALRPRKPAANPADGTTQNVLRPEDGVGSEDRNAARFRTSSPRNPG